MSSVQVQKVINKSPIGKTYLRALLKVLKTPQRNEESLNAKKVIKEEC